MKLWPSIAQLAMRSKNESAWAGVFKTTRSVPLVFAALCGACEAELLSPSPWGGEPNERRPKVIFRAIAFTVVVTIGVVCSREASADADATAKSQQLRLGASLGADRLEILSWPDSEQFLRLRRVDRGEPFDSGRVQFGYDVLEPQAASEDLIKRFAALLLDPSLYDDDATTAIQKPHPRLAKPSSLFRHRKSFGTSG